MMQRTIHLTYKAARRIVIAVVGFTVVILGLVMFVGPGPGLIVLPLGLAILGLEFAWARLWLRKLRRVISNNSLNGRNRRAEAHRDRVSK
jgi:tellurite resistance protein TerC